MIPHLGHDYECVSDLCVVSRLEAGDGCLRHSELPLVTDVSEILEAQLGVTRVRLAGAERGDEARVIRALLHNERTKEVNWNYREGLKNSTAE